MFAHSQAAIYIYITPRSSLSLSLSFFLYNIYDMREREGGGRQMYITILYYIIYAHIQFAFDSFFSKNKKERERERENEGGGLYITSDQVKFVGVHRKKERERESIFHHKVSAFFCLDFYPFFPIFSWFFAQFMILFQLIVKIISFPKWYYKEDEREGLILSCRRGFFFPFPPILASLLISPSPSK